MPWTFAVRAPVHQEQSLPDTSQLLHEQGLSDRCGGPSETKQQKDTCGGGLPGALQWG